MFYFQAVGMSRRRNMAVPGAKKHGVILDALREKFPER